MGWRSVTGQADGTIYAGNLRYRAAQHFGMLEVTAIVEEVSDQLALRNNAQWGEWEKDDLAGLLEGLKAEGTDLDLIDLVDGPRRLPSDGAKV
jgi:ParB-like chromosome segregation protein Spo0J